MQDDRCGVCGGAGDQCKPIKEIYSEPFNVSDGVYVQIVNIPARARRILIKELANSPHFLAIGRAQGEKFYLNGDSLISMPGELEIAGAESLYDRLDERETIKIPQPIQHAIALYVSTRSRSSPSLSLYYCDHLQAIVRSNESNTGIYYEFTLPAFNVTNGRQHQWRLSNWTACSASCGGGVQHREPICQENGKRESILNDPLDI